MYNASIAANPQVYTTMYKRFLQSFLIVKTLPTFFLQNFHYRVEIERKRDTFLSLKAQSHKTCTLED